MSDYAEQKADSIARWTDKTNNGMRAVVVQAIDEAMRDQRMACAEAVLAMTTRPWSQGLNSDQVIGAAHSAAMNAEVKANG